MLEVSASRCLLQSAHVDQGVRWRLCGPWDAFGQALWQESTVKPYQSMQNITHRQKTSCLRSLLAAISKVSCLLERRGKISMTGAVLKSSVKFFMQ